MLAGNRLRGWLRACVGALPRCSRWLLVLFQSSARMLDRPVTLVTTALMIALSMALTTVRIDLSPTLRITFGYLCMAMVGMLYGPVPAMLAAAASDLLNFMLRPTGPFSPAFTLVAVVGGLVYGLLLYRQGRAVRLVDALVAKGVVNVVCNILLNTWFLAPIYGKGFLALLPARALKNALLWPVEACLLYLTAVAVQRVAKRLRIIR